MDKRKGHKNITVSITEEYKRKLELIAKHEYTDKSKLIRKWIDQNFKEEYKKILEGLK